MINFDVCLAKNKGFKINTNIIETVPSIKKLEYLVGSNLEAAYGGAGTDNVIAGGSICGLVDLSMASFASHCHLILDPDTIWLTIEKGLALHITQNSEKLRHHFVDFDGKQTIEVNRDHFIKGNPDNDWEGCFDEFSEKIGEFIGKKRDLIVGDFSTTEKLQRVASEIVLMDSMSNYFNYACCTKCGIPSVTLEGNVSDWENIKERVGNLDEFGLGWWTEKLNPVLDKIIESSKGNVDVDFWYNWYNEGGGSGGPFIGGHVIKFYPYLKYGDEYKQNPFKEGGGMFGGITLSDFPKGISQVPFVWKYYGTNYPMEFIGGVVGVKQRPSDGAVRSAFGWGVREAAVQLQNYPIEEVCVGMVVHNKSGDRGVLKDVKIKDYGTGNEVRSVDVEWDGKGLDKNCFPGYIVVKESFQKKKLLLQDK